MFRLFFVICILTLSLSSNAVIDNQTSNADPYFSTNYTKAFDIAILKKFSNVLEVEGAFCFADLPSYTSCFCGFDSLFSNFRRIASCSIAPKDAQPLSPLLNYETYLNRKNEMNDALLAQLYKEKKAAIWRPAGAATLGIASMVPVSVVGFGVTTLLPPAQQALALWPLMETINKAGDLLQVSATAAFNSLIPPNDPLLALEIEFTKRLPYATEDERKIISNIFAAERAGRTYQTRELRVRIGLIKIKKASSTFFEDTEPMNDDDHQLAMVGCLKNYFFNYNDSREALNKIVGAVSGYLTKLKEGSDTGAYTILLQGSFGTGKSHFAKSLGQFFNQILEEEIPFELVSYTSKKDLLGTEELPGAILTAISKMPKEYGIIFLDEGNMEDLDNIAKLLFDTAGTNYPFPFLRGATRSLKNYLVIVCCNSYLIDPAISSRVVKVDFPTPKKSIIASVVKSLIKSALPKDTPENIIEEYFRLQKIQKIIHEHNHLRLRDQINEVLAGMRVEECNRQFLIFKENFIKNLHLTYGKKVSSILFQALLNSDVFWQQNEQTQLLLIQDTINKIEKREKWLDIISKKSN